MVTSWLGLPNLLSSFTSCSQTSTILHCIFASYYHSSFFVEYHCHFVMLSASPFHIFLDPLCAIWRSIVSSTAPERRLDSSKTPVFVQTDNGMSLFSIPVLNAPAIYSLSSLQTKTKNKTATQPPNQNPKTKQLQNDWIVCKKKHQNAYSQHSPDHFYDLQHP